VTRCPDDEPLYAELMDDAVPERGIARRIAELSPVEKGGHGLLEPLDLSLVARAALQLLHLPPTPIARLIRPVRRYQVVADAKAAAEAMGHVRRLVGEYDGMRRDVMEATVSIVNSALDLDTRLKNHHLDVRIDATAKLSALESARDGRRQRGQIRQQTTRMLSTSAPSEAAAAPGWHDTDTLSSKARITTLKALASIDADEIPDPYVAYAALAYATKLKAAGDEAEARAATFSDVREMLAANGFTTKDAVGFTAALKKLRVEMKKEAGAKSALGGIAAAIKGGGA
jgi:hypothetical protein